MLFQITRKDHELLDLSSTGLRVIEKKTHPEARKSANMLYASGLKVDPGASHQPSEWDQIICFNLFDLYDQSPGSGERQKKEGP